MSLINKIFKVWYCVFAFFGFVGGVILFYVGKSRISLGINSVRISDPYTAHFMNVGLLYIQNSLLILIGFTIFIIVAITYSLIKYKK